MAMEWVQIATAAGYTRTCSVISSLPSMGRDEPLIVALLKSIELLNTSVPLESVRFYQQGESGHYDYKIDAIDNRKWRQDVFFASPGDRDPGMKFSVTDYWKLSEFAIQRQIRDYMIEIGSVLGVTSVVVTYEPV